MKYVALANAFDVCFIKAYIFILVIHSDKKERYHEKSFDSIDVMRKTVSTAAPKIAFGELKDTINKLLHELSRDNNKEYKNAESEERQKV